jgi:hypothetical protein
MRIPIRDGPVPKRETPGVSGGSPFLLLVRWELWDYLVTHNLIEPLLNGDIGQPLYAENLRNKTGLWSHLVENQVRTMPNGKQDGIVGAIALALALFLGALVRRREFGLIPRDIGLAVDP